MVFFLCNDVCFTEDMFTVSGSGCGGDLDDKNSLVFLYFIIIIIIVCTHTQMTFTNMYEKKNKPLPVFCVYIIILISKVPGHNILPRQKKKKKIS